MVVTRTWCDIILRLKILNTIAELEIVEIQHNTDTQVLNGRAKTCMINCAGGFPYQNVPSYQEICVVIVT